MMIFNLFTAQSNLCWSCCGKLKECCMASADMQWLLYSGEQIVAYGPLVSLQNYYKRIPKIWQWTRQTTIERYRKIGTLLTELYQRLAMGKDVSWLYCFSSFNCVGRHCVLLRGMVGHVGRHCVLLRGIVGYGKGCKLVLLFLFF